MIVSIIPKNIAFIVLVYSWSGRKVLRKFVIRLLITCGINLEVSSPRAWKLVQFYTLRSLCFLNAGEPITGCILHQYVACIIVNCYKLLTTELSRVSVHHLRNIWVLNISWDIITLIVFNFVTFIRHLLVRFALNILL